MITSHELRKSSISREVAIAMQQVGHPWEDHPDKYPRAEEMVAQAAKFFNSPGFPEQLHRALDDVYQEIFILKYLLAKGVYSFPREV